MADCSHSAGSRLGRTLRVVVGAATVSCTMVGDNVSVNVEVTVVNLELKLDASKVVLGKITSVLITVDSVVVENVKVTVVVLITVVALQ